jgi:hypothetical protein
VILRLLSFRHRCKRQDIFSNFQNFNVGSGSGLWAWVQGIVQVYPMAYRHLHLVISGGLNCIPLLSQIFANPRAVAKRQLPTIQLKYVPLCFTPLDHESFDLVLQGANLVGKVGGFVRGNACSLSKSRSQYWFYSKAGYEQGQRMLQYRRLLDSDNNREISFDSEIELTITARETPHARPRAVFDGT